MAALTLAMNEVQGVNSEEFLAVRAYHSLGASFRLYIGDRNLASPTNSSSSSGVESYATTTTTSSKGDRHFKDRDSGNDSGSETEHKYKATWQNNSPVIMYEGRNILDLGKNIRPHTWQLTSFIKTPAIPANFNDWTQGYALDICKDCSFITPVSGPIRATRRR